MSVSYLEIAARQLERRNPRFATPGEIARHIDSRIVQTPVLDILDAALVDAFEGPPECRRLIFTMAPQEGKSQRVSRSYPSWILNRDRTKRIASVSYSKDLAVRWGRTVRNDIEANPDLEIKIAGDSRAASEWRVAGSDGGMICVGIGGGLTGRPVDVLLIDDPLKGQAEADSPYYREACWEWWQTTGSARLPEDATVVLVSTRWHHDDLAGRLLAEDRDRWRYINVPAQAISEPDILGRAVGEYMPSTRGRTVAGWEQRKKDAGTRGWQALFQGDPTPAEGGTFKRDWWQIAGIERAPMVDGVRRAIGMDLVIISVDATFKDSKKSDFVVMQVWGKRGGRAYLLDQVRARMDYPTTKRELRALYDRWEGVSAVLIEDKANGPAIISELSSEIPGIIPFTPHESKEARANAVAAFVESGSVELPDPRRHPWVNDFIEECAAFPQGTNDDQVDAMTQALHRLLLNTGLHGFMAQLSAERGGRR